MFQPLGEDCHPDRLGQGAGHSEELAAGASEELPAGATRQAAGEVCGPARCAGPQGAVYCAISLESSEVVLGHLLSHSAGLQVLEQLSSNSLATLE